MKYGSRYTNAFIFNNENSMVITKIVMFIFFILYFVLVRIKYLHVKYNTSILLAKCPNGHILLL